MSKLVLKPRFSKVKDRKIVGRPSVDPGALAPPQYYGEPMPQTTNLADLFYSKDNIMHLWAKYSSRMDLLRMVIPSDIDVRFPSWVAQWLLPDGPPSDSPFYQSDAMTLNAENQRFVDHYVDALADRGAAVAKFNDANRLRTQSQPGIYRTPNPVDPVDYSTSDNRVTGNGPINDTTLFLEALGHAEPYHRGGIADKAAKDAQRAQLQEQLQDQQIRSIVEPMRGPLRIDTLNGGTAHINPKDYMTHEDFENVPLPMLQPVTTVLRETNRGRAAKSAATARSLRSWEDDSMNEYYSLGCIIPAKRPMMSKYPARGARFS